MVDFLLPPALEGRPLLALPAGTPVEGYATSWFPEAFWERHPVRETDTAGLRLAGARFRGMSTAPESRAGLLRLAVGAVLDGPHALDPAVARTLGLPARPLDVYALRESSSDGARGNEAPRDPVLVAAWLEAVARRTGGAVMDGPASPWRVPDPGALVDLTLWTDAAVPASELLPLVRPSLAGTRIGAVRPVAGRGEQAFSVTAESDYDGALVLTSGSSDEVPAVLAGAGWGLGGPWSYAVSWVPEDPFELEQDAPSRLHVIARSRMTSSVARAMATLWRVAGGTVVDAAGFVVTPDELTARSSTLQR